MAHDWQPRPATLANFGKTPRRTCRHCGAVQDLHVTTAWGRVAGRQWLPLVGRCKGRKDSR